MKQRYSNEMLTDTLEKETASLDEAPSFKPSLSDALLKQAYQALDEANLQGFHLYVNTFPVTSKRQFNRYFKHCSFQSGLYLDSVATEHSRDLFMKRLWEIEDSGSSHRNKGTKARYLYCTKIMLPLSVDVTNEEDFKRIEHFLASMNHELFGTDDGDLPFFFGFYKVQTCTYILLFHTERYYYPDGLLVPVVTTSDIYLKKSNKQMCKADDPEAFLYMKKGTVVKEKLIYFTTKHRIFNYSNRKQELALRAKIKTLLVSHLYNVQQDCFASNKTDELRPLFARINYENVRRTELVLKYIEWNKILIKCEDVLHQYILELHEAGFFDDVKDLVLGFIGDWRKRSIQREFNLPTSGRKKIKLRIKFDTDFGSFYSDMHDGIFYAFSCGFENVKKNVTKRLKASYGYAF